MERLIKINSARHYFQIDAIFFAKTISLIKLL